MLRVFLVIDDYNELLYLQTLLKKLGFDIEGLQNTKKYADVSLGFNPHVLITTAHGRKVNGIDLIRTIHKNRGLPKIIALHSTEAPILEDDIKGLGIDLILESPMSAKKLIMGLADLCDLDQASLLEKYNKIKSTISDGNDDDTHVVSYDETGKEISVQPKMFRLNEDRAIGVSFPIKKEPPEINLDSLTTDSDGGGFSDAKPLVEEEQVKDRRKRYDEFLAKVESPKAGHYDRERIAQFNKKIRAATPAPDIAQIERERKEFVLALYEKNQKK